MKSDKNHSSRLNWKLEVLLILCVFLLPIVGFSQGISSSANINNAHSKNKRYIENEIIVKFKENTTRVARISTISHVGELYLNKFLNTTIWRIKLNENQTVEEAIATLNDDPSVEYAEPNYIYHVSSTVPNDTEYDSLWGLKNTGQMLADEVYPISNPGTAGMDLDLESAWDHITNCSSVTVAVADTGINYTHTDLAGNMWDGSGSGYNNHGYDFVHGDDDPVDDHGHGTHVSGTIGAIGNNGSGITGVCWGVKMMALKVCSSDGACTAADIIEGVNFAVTNGADIINMSLGGTDSSIAYSDAIENARSKGVVIIVAAGNDGQDNDNDTALYPCNYTHDNLVCITALDQSYELASFSNYGSTSVDVGAPGTNIKSSIHLARTYTDDDFSSGWILGGGWTTGVLDCLSPTYNGLYNPSDWCDWGLYGNNLNDQTYKTFSIDSGVEKVTLSYWVFIDVEYQYDYFNSSYRSSPGNPFTSGTLIFSLTGTTADSAIYIEEDLNDCIGSSSCAIGFELETDISVGDYGIAIMELSIKTEKSSNSSFELMNGTSMATPHVAGLAAMILAYNPNYTYSDIVNSILSGGDDTSSLATTTTGKAADAFGSLKYINKPTGLIAVVQ